MSKKDTQEETESGYIAISEEPIEEVIAIEKKPGINKKWTAAELEKSRKMMERKYSLGGK